MLLLVATFYAVPSIQFVLVIYSEREQNVPGVYCYYNYKCNHELIGIHAFNNVLSNIGYLFVGIFFLIFVRARDKVIQRFIWV